MNAAGRVRASHRPPSEGCQNSEVPGAAAWSLTYAQPTRTERFPSTENGTVAYALPQSTVPTALILAVMLPLAAAVYVTIAPKK
jgi:hypothetical protein